MSRGSSPPLIPLIGGWSPETPAAGEFRIHWHPPLSRYSFISSELDTVPNGPQRRTGQPREPAEQHRVSKQQQRPWTANAPRDKQVVSRLETQLRESERERDRAGSRLTVQTI
ncbi:uncharacterized protein V6R79_012116 [Siganus canaliculatus]